MPLDCIHSYLRLYLYLLKTLYSEFASLSSFIDLQCSHHPKSRQFLRIASRTQNKPHSPHLHLQIGRQNGSFPRIASPARQISRRSRAIHARRGRGSGRNGGHRAARRLHDAGGRFGLRLAVSLDFYRGRAERFGIGRERRRRSEQNPREESRSRRRVIV